MDATHLDTFIDALIGDLTPAPDDAADRRLCHLLDIPSRIVDEHLLLAVLAAAVTARNLVDHVTAQAVAAAERVGIEFADAVGQEVAHVAGRVALSDEDRAGLPRVRPPPLAHPTA
ncbi:hypothetical protein [Mycolicibacterium frederiksbergense]|uniref:Uncharacterized protein n=1 Tax=Mycolicibacterium frederiksbergense TaxID=117567 RepID=A0A6H0S5J8_9MYCO|nr:hypothetical protein [Mycolicibacterium frederiksbergense]QIV82618.1 hypothetical protein EXE63_18350 [Mycolicibacterium frederiksbergense]